jgi:hypothetical protein
MFFSEGQENSHTALCPESKHHPFYEFQMVEVIAPIIFPSLQKLKGRKDRTKQTSSSSSPLVSGIRL